MRLNKKHDPIVTMDFHCDLFKNDCIKPEKLLSEKDAEKVRKAMEVIDEFEQALIDAKLIEEV